VSKNPLERTKDTASRHVGPVAVVNYKTFLAEPSRPPSKGGNTRAWHQHSFEVEGQRYSFLALGAKKWIYQSDTTQFLWEWDATGKYRNIIPETIKTLNKSGGNIVRGERGTKKRRTAESQIPASRREQRD
jgi:hypothetical protein